MLQPIVRDAPYRQPVGYFDGLDSQRATAQRYSDSRSLQSSLNLGRKHLANKIEHAIDLGSDLVLAVAVFMLRMHARAGDSGRMAEKRW